MHRCECVHASQNVGQQCFKNVRLGRDEEDATRDEVEACSETAAAWLGSFGWEGMLQMLQGCNVCCVWFGGVCCEWRGLAPGLRTQLHHSSIVVKVGSSDQPESVRASLSDSDGPRGTTNKLSQNSITSVSILLVEV
jgi:hypothetical protein